MSSSEYTAGLLEGFAYGRGFPDLLLGTQPAAGANFTLSISPRFQTRLIACVFTLVTSSATANRAVTVDCDNGGGTVFCSSGPGVVQTASSTQVYAGSAARGQGEWASGTTVFFPLQPLFLVGGERLQINVVNIQTADQLSGIVFRVEQFEVGPSGYREGQLGALAGGFTGGRRRR